MVQSKDDSDTMGSVFRAMTRMKKEAHLRAKETNTKYLKEKATGRFSEANYGECLMFREPGYPKIDYYPSTGRWRDGNKTHRGCVEAFWNWYVKKEAS